MAHRLYAMNVIYIFCSFCFISGGKSDEDQIIPLNDSISLTLDTDYVKKKHYTISKQYLEYFKLNFYYI